MKRNRYALLVCSYEANTGHIRRFIQKGIEMCNTVPKVICNLGYDCPNGFTKKEFIAAFLRDGYGIKKAERHWITCLLSNAIIPTPDDETGETFISIYSTAHYLNYEKDLNDVEINPVKINRDGRAVRII